MPRSSENQKTARHTWALHTLTSTCIESQAALRHAQLAEAAMGDSEPIHLIRATAYGQEGLLQKATTEYRAALKILSQDGSLYLGLGNALLAERRYHEAINELHIAEKLSPRIPRCTRCLRAPIANLQDREQSTAECPA